MDLSNNNNNRTIFNPADENYSLLPRKRRRSSTHDFPLPPHGCQRDQDMDARMASDPYIRTQENGTMTVPNKLADRNVAPFLAKYIPEQHTSSDVNNSKKEKPYECKDQTSVHCCRNRSEIKCRRQADESTMDQLQRVSYLSSHSASACGYKLTSHCKPCRSYRHSRRVTSSPSPMSGLSSRPPRPNTGI